MNIASTLPQVKDIYSDSRSSMKAKRSRIVVAPQSRAGCSTCKSRRIKCDETRPYCLRCSRSQRACEGYPEPVNAREKEQSQNASDQAQLSLAFQPTWRICDDSRHARLVSLACSTLPCDKSTSAAYDYFVWKILPQLSVASPALAFTLASLGATLDFVVPSAPAAYSERLALQLYGDALHAIQDEVNLSTMPNDALLLGCILLACIEIIQWREDAALTHVQGATSLLEMRSTSAIQRVRASGMDEAKFFPRNELDLMFVQLDLQTASYALGLPPRLPTLDMKFILDMPPFSRPNRLYLECIRSLHASYHLAVLASVFKYISFDLAPADLKKQMLDQIAELRAVIRELNDCMAESKRFVTYDNECLLSLGDVLMLRMQCLASIVYLLSKMHPEENGYDAYGEQFQQIILDGESLVSKSDFRYRPFSAAGIGIIQPLFLTAVKYRHPVWRWRAIAVLQLCGREGPFHGRFSAVAARALAEVEEKGCGECFTAADINELGRIHGLSMILERSGPPDSNVGRIEMSRCVDMDALRVDSISCWETVAEYVTF